MNDSLPTASAPSPSAETAGGLGGQSLALYFQSRLPDLPERVLEDVWRSIPDIARTSPHSPGRDDPPPIDRRLRAFVRNIADPGRSPEDRARMHRVLGRSAYLHGVGPALLQSAYQAGARFAWRRLAEAVRRSGATAGQLQCVTEAVLASAEELAGHALASYRELSEDTTDTLHANRRRLLRVILAERGTLDPGVLPRAAHAARWTVPRTIACVVLDRTWEAGERLSPALDPDVLSDLRHPEPRLILPEPDRPGRIDRLRRGLQGTRFAVGTRVSVAEATQSLRTAEQALSLLRQGTFPGADHVRCDEHLSTLLLLNDEHLARRLVEHRMAALEGLAPEPRRRLLETLLAWLSTGSQAQAAARLHLHPQTVRYRMRRLDELFGDQLHDPAWRFEMELAIRAHRLLPAPATANT
ncbi:PucR family transcriptional regulator [Actinomadura fibrosa]|uniref:PucR family transcriptional regulator n=1 Tax=Actinomadura fibrosa TaxID=111802 RepID=A0ABW2XW41_9ACTN|nr:PucR family transcriptional regulator [Actinomadura fibrosa]